jgi:hypothetical protein
MQVKRLREAKPYEAPNHRGYCSLRLFGLDAGGPKQFTVGLSHFLPGGGAGPDASPTEKVYYLLSGELTLIAAARKPCSRPGTPASSGRTRAARSSIAAMTS